MLLEIHTLSPIASGARLNGKAVIPDESRRRRDEIRNPEPPKALNALDPGSSAGWRESPCPVGHPWSM